MNDEREVHSVENNVSLVQVQVLSNWSAARFLGFGKIKFVKRCRQIE